MAEMPDDVYVYYRAGRQGLKVRIVIVVAYLAGAGCFWAAWAMIPSLMSLEEAPGGGTFWEWLALFGLVVTVGLVLAGGMTVYASCYVSRIELNRTDGRTLYRTMAIVGRRNYLVDPDDKAREKQHDGKFEMPRFDEPALYGNVSISMSTPWSSLRLPGKWLPLIIDDMGDLYDPEGNQIA